MIVFYFLFRLQGWRGVLQRLPVAITILLSLHSISLSAATQTITLNQLGFLPNGGKIAVIPNCDSGEFWLVSAQTNSEVLRGPLSQPVVWKEAGETVKIADFSAFNKSGEYYLSVTGVGKSAIFSIAERRYDKALYHVAKTFYLHRAGVEVEQRFSDGFARSAGHPDLLVYTHQSAQDRRLAATILSSPKGWYDSGDYNKYTVNTALAVHFLLRSHAAQAEYFQTLRLNIPESENPLPDILDETLWGIDWLLSVQDADGGVFQRLGSLNGDAEGMPGEQRDARYVMQKTTGATLYFAAVMAHASRVMKEFDAQLPGRSALLLHAAERAWQWAEKNPKSFFAQPAGVSSQLYAWTNDPLQDERLWAAAELSHASGKRNYLKAAKIPAKILPLQWQHVDVLGLLALLENQKTPNSLRTPARAALLKLADDYVRQYWRSGYLVPMEQEDFVRGSNFIALNKAFTLVAANSIAARAEYRDAARGVMDYMLGRNPLATSYVTGVGSKTAMAPRDWISQFDTVKSPLPGMVVGGPFALANERCDYSGKAPALHFADGWCSAQTSQVSLAGSAALLYVLANLRVGPETVR